MGYIFDALKKSPDSGEKKTASNHPSPRDEPSPNYKLPRADTKPSLDRPGPRPHNGPNHTPAATPIPQGTAPANVAASPPVRVTPKHPDDRLVAITQPSEKRTEEYRTLRSGLLARWGQRRHLVHAITSATRQEGKTLTCLNLALSLAEIKDRRTIVVEADLRHPAFAQMLSIPTDPGLVSVLEGRAATREAIFCLERSGLFVLPAGPGPCGQPLQLLSGAKMQATIAQLRLQFDHVIVDTPPAGELADACVAGTLCDEVLLVAKASQTPTALIEQAVRNLAQYSVNLAGVIVTDQHRTTRPSSWGVVPQQTHAQAPKAQAA